MKKSHNKLEIQVQSHHPEQLKQERELKDLRAAMRLEQ